MKKPETKMHVSSKYEKKRKMIRKMEIVVAIVICCAMVFMFAASMA